MIKRFVSPPSPSLLTWNKDKCRDAIGPHLTMFLSVSALGGNKHFTFSHIRKHSIKRRFTCINIMHTNRMRDNCTLLHYMHACKWQSFKICEKYFILSNSTTNKICFPLYILYLIPDSYFLFRKILQYCIVRLKRYQNAVKSPLGKHAIQSNVSCRHIITATNCFTNRLYPDLNDQDPSCSLRLDIRARPWTMCPFLISMSGTEVWEKIWENKKNWVT